jgi:hypothetical protein
MIIYKKISYIFDKKEEDILCKIDAVMCLKFRYCHFFVIKKTTFYDKLLHIG